MANSKLELDPRGQGPDAPWHLIESRTPVFDEVTVLSDQLEVKGTIPPELSGRYIRNTANPQTGWTEHWFIGDGMLHGIELQNGKATWYRNRYVRTPSTPTPEPTVWSWPWIRKHSHSITRSRRPIPM